MWPLYAATWLSTPPLRLTAHHHCAFRFLVGSRLSGMSAFRRHPARLIWIGSLLPTYRGQLLGGVADTYPCRPRRRSGCHGVTLTREATAGRLAAFYVCRPGASWLRFPFDLCAAIASLVSAGLSRLSPQPAAAGLHPMSLAGGSPMMTRMVGAAFARHRLGRSSRGLSTCVPPIIREFVPVTLSGSAPKHIPCGLVGGRNCVVCAVIPNCGDLLRYGCIRMGRASWNPLRTDVALYRLNLPSQIHTHPNNARSYGGRSVYRIACFNRPGSIGRRCRLVQKRQQPQNKQNHSISPVDYKERDYQLARFRAALSQPQ